MSNNKKDDTSNSLFIQLQKDLRRKENKNREYIPKALFNNPGNIDIKLSKKISPPKRVLAMIGSLIK